MSTRQYGKPIARRSPVSLCTKKPSSVPICPAYGANVVFNGNQSLPSLSVARLRSKSTDLPIYSLVYQSRPATDDVVDGSWAEKRGHWPKEKELRPNAAWDKFRLATAAEPPRWLASWTSLDRPGSMHLGTSSRVEGLEAPGSIGFPLPERR